MDGITQRNEQIAQTMKNHLIVCSQRWTLCLLLKFMDMVDPIVTEKYTNEIMIVATETLWELLNNYTVEVIVGGMFISIEIPLISMWHLTLWARRIKGRNSNEDKYNISIRKLDSDIYTNEMEVVSTYCLTSPRKKYFYCCCMKLFMN